MARWSEETFTIQEVVLNQALPLPIIVKVEEGIYGTAECESFCQDDLIKLHGVKEVKKVVISVVDHNVNVPASDELDVDLHGYVKRAEDMIVPLTYKGIVKIAQPETEKIFYSVEELIQVFPRYVKLLNSLTDREGNDLSSGDIIELDRVFPGTGLICSLRKGSGKDMGPLVLDISDKHRFLLISDNNDYTLKEVIERFPLPQYVKFVDGNDQKLVITNIQESVTHSQFFERTVKIKEIIDQKIITGHHKSAELSNLPTEIDRRKQTLVIIPLTSNTASMLDVKVPLGGDGGIIDAFPHIDPNEEEEKDGTVYVDYLDKPKDLFINVPESVPPPVPFRKSIKRPLKGQQLQKSTPRAIEKTDSIKGDIPAPPPRPPKRKDDHSRRSSSKHLSMEVDQVQCPEIDERKTIVQPDEHTGGKPDMIPPSEGSENQPVRYSTMMSSASLKEVTEKIRIEQTNDQLREKMQVVSPSKEVSIDKAEDYIDDYAQIRLSDDDGENGYVSISETAKTKILSQNAYQPQLRSEEKTKRDEEDISRTEEPQPDPKVWFQSLSSNDLYQHLKKCKMDEMALICKDEGLDGKFFKSITDEELMCDFKLNRIQLLKFRRIQNEGWVIS